MITRQQKIDAIYKKIARKDLDFWCIVESKWGQSVFLADRNRREIFRTNYRIVDFIGQDEPMEIIGHPVMIGDVMDFIEKNTQEIKHKESKWEWVIKIQLWCSRDKAIEIFTDHIIFVWQNKRFSIEEQPDKCIDFVYSLISK